MLALGLMQTIVAQVESVGPITRQVINSKKITRASNDIDSTYIYLQDTLTLPLFDEFSKSRFQQYNAQPTDPNVTEQLYYQLLDQTNVPLPANSKYSLTETNRYVTNAGSTDTIPLVSIQIKIGAFTGFPIVYATTTVWPAYNLFDTLDFVNPIDTIFQLPPDVLQDSALIFAVVINDPNAVWIDHFAYHNYNLPSFPWSLGVASFDGLNENGYPYNFGSATSGVADYLTSKPLDLSILAPSDSIYLSFLVQPKGLGDEPEATDSLILEFYDVAANEWNRIWGMGGGPLTDFKVGHIRITQAMYLTNGFQFRFKNLGGLSGALDHFHLDYVNLRTLSGYQDTLFKDFAFVYPIGSLIKEYTQVPWDHWKNSSTGHMNDAVKVVVRNGSNLPENNQNGSVKVELNGTTESTFTMIAQNLSGGDLNYAPRTFYETFHDFTGGYEFDPLAPGDEVAFDLIGAASAQFPNFPQNDSCFAQQVFGDCYAYDDGSAEAAYGPTGVQARLAYQFTPYENDSLIGVKMHFVPSVNDVSNKLFLLTVWSDNAGQPGSVIYEDEFFYPRTPFYEDSIGKFTTYYLKDTLKLPITGTFYVGWRQIDADRLNIGMDHNTQNGDKIFYSINGGGTWSTSSFNSSLMMRPIFSTATNADLVVEELAIQPSWEVYPNPTSGEIRIKWGIEGNFPGASCRDAQGRIVGQTETADQSIDLTNAPAGIYFVQLNGFDHLVKKVIRY